MVFGLVTNSVCYSNDQNVEFQTKLMCIHCTNPVVTVVSPVLSSSEKAASPGMDLQLHVPHSLHLCPAEQCWCQRHSLTPLKGAFHCVWCHLPALHGRVLLAGVCAAGPGTSPSSAHLPASACAEQGVEMPGVPWCSGCLEQAGPRGWCGCHIFASL